MLKPGMFISDRYEIIEKVGSGGMADVYKARCHRLNRFVAIKVLKAEYSDDKSFVLKFRAEAQSAAGLSHPNIVNVYDVGDDEGLYYIVMELVEGITLKSFIERKSKLEVKEAVGIAIQIAQGLEAAHDNHIIHRDIKPQNIIISREGKVKVTDFGIAKAATSNTINSNAMGSVHYISPEQARGGYSDEKSDIYSLGITLYEMLSGMVPFAGENTVSVALLHIQGEATPLRQLDASIPISLERIVAKCMEKKPERRYHTASELIADLKRSIVNPSGDFVKMAAPIVDSSPTINISEEEISTIKKAANKSSQPTQVKSVKPVPPVDEDDEDDEDESKEVDPKLDKVMIIGAIVITAILAIMAFAFIGNVLGVFGGSKSESLLPTVEPSPTISSSLEPTVSPTVDPQDLVRVTSVVGKSLEDAESLLQEENLVVRTKEENSDTIPKDYIIRQSIDPGEKVEAGSEIVLTVSLGAESFAVPTVTNKSLSEAKNSITNLGLKYSTEYEYSDKVEEEKVIRTEPSAGSSVSKGDTIKIILSKGKEIKTTKVPDIRGLSKEDAKEALEEKGLKLGNVTNEYSSEYAKGLVMAQEVKANKEVDQGTKVSVTISKGPQATPAPQYEYRLNARIQNPFSDSEEGGQVRMILVQDGTSTEIKSSSYMTSANFPYTLQYTSKSGSQGVIYIYVDDVEKLQTPAVFEKVQVN